MEKYGGNVSHIIRNFDITFSSDDSTLMNDVICCSSRDTSQHRCPAIAGISGTVIAGHVEIYGVLL
jgi:hypothetical protein